MILLSKKVRWLCFVVAVIFVLSGIAAIFFLSYENEEYTGHVNEKMVYHADAVASNGPECAAIGMEILKKHNGTAVDASLATLFCEGVTVTQSMGLGGGFIATIYDKASGKVETLIARERAPLASHETMFVNMSTVEGILSVAVPGELKGYAEMHKKYGRAPWKTLIQPTIDLCRSGHVVSHYLERVLRWKEKEIYESPSLREVFANPKTGKIWKTGDKIKRLKLAETLEIIANEGAESMYTADGTIAKALVEEIRELGGILTIEDFVNYAADWEEPVSTELRGNYTIHTVPLPASGLILTFILNILNEYVPSLSSSYLHKMIESFKFGYAKRTLLGDGIHNPTLLNELTDKKFAEQIRSQILDNQTFNNFEHYGAQYGSIEDHGTAQVSVLTKNGDAVSVTSTINSIFGSKIRSQSTGIILNDQMDDFSTPGKKNGFGVYPSPANYIKPNKRPLSSMCPIIILDQNKDAILVAGSAGGSKITTTVAYVLARHLWLGESLEKSIHARRIHHQLLPMEVVHETEFDTSILNELKQFGHIVSEDEALTGFTAVTAISRARGHVEATFDPRRFGSTKID